MLVTAPHTSIGNINGWINNRYTQSGLAYKMVPMLYLYSCHHAEIVLGGSEQVIPEKPQEPLAALHQRPAKGLKPLQRW